MDFLNTLIDYLINQDFSMSWAIVSALVGYLIYNQHQSCKDMAKYKEEMVSLLKDNKYRHEKIEEDLQNLKLTVKEDITPVLRKMELNIQDLEDIDRAVKEVKADERALFNSLRDDFNQFRSEFRDILKLVLNGRKMDR